MRIVRRQITRFFIGTLKKLRSVCAYTKKYVLSLMDSSFQLMRRLRTLYLCFDRFFFCFNTIFDLCLINRHCHRREILISTVSDLSILYK